MPPTMAHQTQTATPNMTMMMRNSLIILFLCLSSMNSVNGFAPSGVTNFARPAQTFMLAAHQDEAETPTSNSNSSSRRQVFATLGTFLTVAATTTPQSALADDTIYITGKAPQVPGQKPAKDKNDVKGTRKDPNFLRSISDCKSQCENSGSGGLAKSKEDCLSECQDICCTTYEQCTFSIVPRI